MKKYNVSKEFGFWSKFKPPMNKLILPVAQLITNQMYKCLKRKREITFEKVKTTNFSAFLIKSKREENSSTCLIYFHGGAFIYNASNYHYLSTCKYVENLGCDLLMVNYSLSPKHRHPEQINQCESALIYASENYSNLLIGGDSAGGFLAIKTALKACNLKIKVGAVMLIYPVVDNKMQTASMKEFYDTPMWNSRCNKKMWRWYYGGENLEESLLDINLPSSFPPTYVETAQFDCLNNEGLIFAENLKKAGCKVVVNQTKNTMHGFDAVDCPTTQKAFLERIEFLKNIQKIEKTDL